MTTQTPAPARTSTRRKLAYAVGGALILFVSFSAGLAYTGPDAGPVTASPDLQGLIDQANANAKTDGAAVAADAAGANTATKFAAPPAPAAPVGPVTGFADGTFVVGSDIKAGTYKANPVGECYWARLSSTSSESDITANHFGPGPTTVTIDASDKAFLSSDCGTWVRVR